MRARVSASPCRSSLLAAARGGPSKPEPLSITAKQWPLPSSGAHRPAPPARSAKASRPSARWATLDALQPGATSGLCSPSVRGRYRRSCRLTALRHKPTASARSLVRHVNALASTVCPPLRQLIRSLDGHTRCSCHSLRAKQMGSLLPSGLARISSSSTLHWH